MSAVMKDNIIYFIGSDDSGNTKLIQPVKLESNIAEALKKELNVVIDGEPRICTVNVKNGNIEFLGGFEKMTDMETFAVNDALYSGDRKTIRKHITMTVQMCNEIQTEIESHAADLEIQRRSRRCRRDLRHRLCAFPRRAAALSARARSARGRSSGRGLSEQGDSKPS
jgi:hypothetical protein